MVKFLKGVALFLYGFLEVGLSAWTITMLWGWFVVATFGLPVLSIPVVIGLEILHRAFVFNAYQQHSAAEKTRAVAITEGLFVSLIALAAGFLIHLASG